MKIKLVFQLLAFNGCILWFRNDNAIVEIDNQEVPILDGSAKIFVEEILKVGLEK